MSLTISGENSCEDRPKLQPGIYLGACYQIVDMGESDITFQDQKVRKKECN